MARGPYDASVFRLVRTLGVVLLGGLLIASGGAFLWAQVKKNEPSPIVGPRFLGPRVFSPVAFKPARREVVLRFGLRRPDDIRVVIQDLSGTVVAEAATVREGRNFIARWDGLKANGDRADDGRYRFAIELQEADRVILLPDAVLLDATPPVISSNAKAGQRIAPGLEGSAGEYSFVIRASEPVRLQLDVRQVRRNGTARQIRLERGMQFARISREVWRADRGYLRADQVGRPAARGNYIVGWQATDRAGNRVIAPEQVAPGQLAPAQVVSVETIALTPDLLPRTLAAEVRLQRHAAGALFPGPAIARADGAPGEVVLPEAEPGLYAVRATARGWEAWAPEAVPGRRAVLLLAPLYSWQATNPADGDDDGFPDVPPQPLGLDRAYDERIVAPLARLARTRDTTQRRLRTNLGSVTDRSIEQDGVPEGVRLLVIARAPVWTPGLIDELRRFSRRGGRVLILDERSFRRAAERTEDAIILGPARRPSLNGVRLVENLSTAREFLNPAATSRPGPTEDR